MTLEEWADMDELAPRKRPTLVLSAGSGKPTVPGCAGLRLDLDALWAELDRLPVDEPAPRRGAKPRSKRRSR